MGKDTYESNLKISELKKLKINLAIEEDQVVLIANNIIQECRKELLEMKNHNRFVIQTQNGGYYFP